jgi:hypothetical protein
LQGNGDFLLTVGSEVHRLQVALIGNRELGRLPHAETTPRLDFGDYDPARVLEMTDKPKATPLGPAPVAYALATDCGIPTLRERYGPMGAKRATRIRDFAQAVRAALAELGYTYPLPLTNASQEMAQVPV